MALIRSGHQRALLVVDVQVGVVAQVSDAPAKVAQVALAVEGARAAGLPVVWVQHEDEDLVRDSEAWQWAAELVPAAGELRIFKRYNSAFEDTALEQTLATLGVSHIVLAGAMTNWCIRASAYAALERGYDLTLLKDAHMTGPISLPDGRQIAAADLVHDLNTAMTWLQYPGRRTGTALAQTFAQTP